MLLGQIHHANEDILHIQRDCNEITSKLSALSARVECPLRSRDHCLSLLAALARLLWLPQDQQNERSVNQQQQFEREAVRMRALDAFGSVTTPRQKSAKSTRPPQLQDAVPIAERWSSEVVLLDAALIQALLRPL